MVMVWVMVVESERDWVKADGERRRSDAETMEKRFE